jgi:hypothetical protein
MPKFRVLAMAGVAVALALAAVPSVAGATRAAVHGKLTAQIEGDDAAGRFSISHRESDGGAILDRIEVGAVKLDATVDAGGLLPVYNVVLVTADASTSADFGAARLSKRGKAAFRFTTRVTALPDGVTDVTMFDGGTIEVRAGSTVVLAGTIPSFIGPGDDNEGSGGAFRRDTERLAPAADGIRTRGMVGARYANTPRGVSEQIWVQAEHLQRNAGPYSLVAIDAALAEIEICTLAAHGRRGADVITIDTRRGDEIPGGGSVQDISGQSLELRDKDGNVVCTGTFPKVD